MTQENDRPGTDLVATRPPEDGVPALAMRYGDDKRLDVARFEPSRVAVVRRIVASVPKLDGQAVNGFGVAIQQKTNRYLDDLLEGMRTQDVGGVGPLVAGLATGVRMLDLPGLKREAEGKLPIKARIMAMVMPGLARADRGLAGLVARNVLAFQRFRANHATILSHLTRIEEEGRRDMARLTAMDAKLDALVDQNLESMRELEEHVAAGQEILDRERERFGKARDAAVSSRDPARLAAVRDFGEQINAFETRLLRLHMAMTDAMLNIPQTRLTQSAGRIEYRNIADTLLFDMPRLKKAIVRVAALKGISEARKGSEARRRLAQQVEAIGISALDDAYTQAKESEAGALGEIAAMGEIADRILGIIDKGAEIDARNRRTREEATRRLDDLRERFVDGLGRSTANAVARS